MGKKQTLVNILIDAGMCYSAQNGSLAEHTAEQAFGQIEDHNQTCSATQRESLAVHMAEQELQASVN